MKLRILNKTNHYLMITQNISIIPKGSIETTDIEYSDHLKTLERNNFISVEIIPDNIVSNTANATEEVAEEVSVKKSSRAKSKNTVDIDTNNESKEEES